MSEAVAGGPAETLHRRLRDAILAQIGSGEWAPHQRIASERELCERHGVSRTTTRRVLSDLAHEGVVYTVVGKGTFVSGHPLRQELQPLVGFTEDLRGQGVEVRSRVESFRRIEADADLAAHLHVRPHAAVIELSRCRFAGATPLAVQTSYLPEQFCPGILRFDFTAASLFDALRREYGLRLVEGETVIKPGLADAREAELFACEGPTAVLRTFQTTFLADGEVIEYCVSAFRGDIFELTVGVAAGRILSFDPAVRERVAGPRTRRGPVVRPPQDRE